MMSDIRTDSRSVKKTAKGTECIPDINDACRPIPKEKINHPKHYGGADDPYEAIKVIEAWELNFSLGSVLKYVRRAGKKEGEDELVDLRKAVWYLNREITRREGDRDNA